MNGSNVISPSEFWAGKGGDDYTERHDMDRAQSIASRVGAWRPILDTLHDVRSIMEVGANLGDNLAAISQLTKTDLYAIEPNPKAADALRRSNFIRTENVSCRKIQDLYASKTQYDLVFTCGVLIHIDPESIMQACANIYDLSNRYIVVMEYFAPQEEEIPYRGLRGLLWRRDYGSLFFDNFKLRTIRTGFLWKPITGMDNLTWWLFRKI